MSFSEDIETGNPLYRREVETVDIEDMKKSGDIFSKESATLSDIEKSQKSFQKRVLSKGFVNEGLDVKTNARLSIFEKEKLYPNMWTESSMNLLESWLVKCEDAAEAHTNAAKGSRTKNRQVAIPSICLGASATALAFFSVGDSCDVDDNGPGAISISVAVLTSALSVLGGISSLYSFSEKQSKHIAAAGSFTNLARKIQVCIFLPMSLRAQCEVVLTDVSAEFANLVNTSPLL